MDINYFYPMWGSENLPFQEFCKKVKDAGYDGIEMNISFDEDYAIKLRKLLSRYELKLVAQQWLEPKDETPEEYKERMKKYLLYLASFNPVFINSHTGKDFYSFEDNCMIFEAATEISKDTGIKIVHETHRGRALFSTVMAEQYFKVFSELRINADFSHWCCVSESLLQDQKDFMSQAVLRADYIHARVGYEQGPQINNIQYKQNKMAIETHLLWWKQIIANARLREQKEMAVCTEFGPVPYLQTLPFSDVPVVSQWEQNLLMKRILTDSLC